MSTCFAISRWRIRSSLSYRIYIFLILILCYGFPCFTIVTSYFVISVMVKTCHKIKELGNVSVDVCNSCLVFLVLFGEMKNCTLAPPSDSIGNDKV